MNSTDPAAARRRSLFFNRVEAGSHTEEEIDRVIVAEIEVGPGEPAELAARPDQGDLGKDPFPQINFMSAILMRADHQVAWRQNAGVDIDCAKGEIMHLVAKLRFQLVAARLDLDQTLAWHQSLEREEAALKIGPHLLGVVTTVGVWNIDSLSLDPAKPTLTLAQRIGQRIAR